MILNYDDAYEAITRGETDWETLTCRVGRNDLPAILSEVAWSMTDDELASALRDSWVMAESPENCLDRETGRRCRGLRVVSVADRLEQVDP